MRRTMWGSMAMCGLITVGLITLPSYADERATPESSVQERGLPSFPPPPPPPAPPAPPALPSPSSQSPSSPPLPTFPIEIQTSGEGSVSYQIYNLAQCGMGSFCSGTPVHAYVCPPVCRWVPVGGWYGWIDLQPLAAPGSSFKVWGGRCADAGQTPYCRLYMDRQQTVQATFQKTAASSSRKSSASQPQRAR